LIWSENSDKLILSLSEAHSIEIPAASNVRINTVSFQRIERTYGAVKIGSPLALVGSSGFLEIAINGGNAAARFGIKQGAQVSIKVSKAK